MPANKNVDPKKNVTQFKQPEKQKQNKHRTTWILSLIILVIVVVTFVVGPAIGAFAPQEKGIVFGSYDGQNIEYSYNSYMYRQQQQIAANWETDTTADNYQYQIYQIWKSAFDNSVLNAALNSMAKKAEITITSKGIDTYLSKNGPYINAEGKFDPQLYAEDSDAERAQVRSEAKETLISQRVVSDLFSVRTAPQEIQYIKDMGKTEKSFSYVVFPFTSFPEEKVLTYAQANAMKFSSINIHVITLKDDELEAQTVYDKIINGEILFEDAARTYSIDSYSENGGDAGWNYFYQVALDFDDEDAANRLFSLSKGSVSELYKTAYGYNIYRVNESPKLPDLTDTAVISDIRNYILAYDNEIVENYLLSRAEEFKTAAKVDFNNAALTYDVNVHEVAPTPLNYGNSMFLSSFSYTDTDQLLANSVANDSVLKALYSTEKGAVSEVFTVNTGIAVATCTEEAEASEESLNSLDMFYGYLMQQITQDDFVDAVFKSDLLVDNFLNVFLSKILASS